MKNRRQMKDDRASEYVIKRPLFWPLFLLIMFLLCLSLCFLEASNTESKDLFDSIAAAFYIFAGFSIWLPFTGMVFILLVTNFYFYFRFKLVVHEKVFSVTPLFGPTHAVPYSSVEKVILMNRFNKKGYYVDIKYQNQKVHIPYTINRNGELKQKGIEVLLKRFKNYQITISED